MNGRKAREIRALAWEVLMAHGVRSGSASPDQLRRLNRRMKSDYRRTGTLPRVVPAATIPAGAFRRRSR